MLDYTLNLKNTLYMSLGKLQGAYLNYLGKKTLCYKERLNDFIDRTCYEKYKKNMKLFVNDFCTMHQFIN